MDRISELLSRLPIPGLKESNDRHTIARILSELIKIPIKANQIVFKDNILTVSVPPVVKSVLHIKQSEIAELLSREGLKVLQVR